MLPRPGGASIALKLVGPPGIQLSFKRYLAFCFRENALRELLNWHNKTK